MKCIFDFDVEELIRNKDMVLFNLNQVQHDYLQKESNLLLNTNFKELGLTNEKMRQAYINNELSDLKFSIDAHKHSLAIINDLLKLRLTEMEVKTE